MPLLFCFTDAPQLGDVWETNLDIDVLIHTRPPLLAERDRFATHYGTSYAQRELQRFVIRGLKAYGYNVLPSIYYLVSDFFLKLEPQAYNDHAIATDTLEDPGATPQEMAQSLADFATLERHLWDKTLDSPELIQKFINGPLTKLAGLDPIRRINEIYKLRAAQFAQNIPFAQNADTILARLFQESLEYDPYTVTSSDRFNEVHKALIHDIVAGLIDRLENNTLLLDQILNNWVVPKLHDRFPEIDAEIDEFVHVTLNGAIERTDFIHRSKADPDWLALAKNLGAPVPHPSSYPTHQPANP